MHYNNGGRSKKLLKAKDCLRLYPPYETLSQAQVESDLAAMKSRLPQWFS